MRQPMDGVRFQGQISFSNLEDPSPDSAAKADALAQRLQEVFRGADVHVSRPVKSAELQLTGLHESVTAETVTAAIAAAGGCPAGDVRIDRR